MGRRALLLMLLVLAVLAWAVPAGADDVADAQRRVDDAAKELDRLRGEYAVLSEQARGVANNADRARLRVVNVQLSVNEAEARVSDSRLSVAARARSAYMDDRLGNVAAGLRMRDYAQIDAYLPYVARPLEEDRRTVEVYQQRLSSLRDLQGEMATASGDLQRREGDLGTIESRLTANLEAQQAKLAAARHDLEAAQAAETARTTAAASAANAARSDTSPPVGAPAASSAHGDVPRGPQPGSGPGPEAGIPDPIDVPPAPKVLPNGVELGPVAGIPQGMKSTGIRFSGVASWYGPGFHGHTTANGETYDQYGFTAASKTLPFGTVLLVSFQSRSVLLRINDRGPYVDGRELDLSKGAADALGIGGLGYIDAEIVEPASP
jgi:rare lipoprotein A